MPASPRIRLVPDAEGVFSSKQEAPDAGRERAREEGVRLRIQDVSGDTHKRQRDQQPGEGMPDWVEPGETL